MELALAAIFGLVVGSFLNVCIVRIPAGLSISLPRSHCPRCKKPIAPYDNIPILSYLILGGKCRHCKAGIAFRYPLVEGLTGVVSALLYQQFGLSLQWGIYLVFSAALIVLAFVDIDHRILPDPITRNGIWIGLVVSVAMTRPDSFAFRVMRWVGAEGVNPRVLAGVGSVLGIIAGGGLLWLVGEVFFRVRGIEGMGFGDVKMMAMVGAFLGAPLTLLTIMIGSLLGSVVGVALMKFQGKTREYELPFGTFLGAAGIVAVLYGDALIGFYITHFMRFGQ